MVHYISRISPDQNSPIMHLGKGHLDYSVSRGGTQDFYMRRCKSDILGLMNLRIVDIFGLAVLEESE